MGIAAVGKAVVECNHYQRAFPKVAALLMLGMCTSALTALLVALLLCGGYMALIDYGFAAHTAFIAVTLCLVAIIAAGFFLISHNTKKLRRALLPLAPVGEGISDVITAFADGFRRG